MKWSVSIAVVVLSAAVLPLQAQSGRKKPPPAKNDSAFRALQARGAAVMGVDQYTSAHVFESLADGGRIELQRSVDDSAGVRVIRAHMQEVAERFTNGDFALSEMVHATHDIPGVDSMRALGDTIRYSYRQLPRGAEVRLTTRDERAVRAIHAFLAFQRSDHRSHSQGH